MACSTARPRVWPHTHLAQRVCVTVVEHVEAAVQVDADGAPPPLAVALQDASQVVGQ